MTNDNTTSTADRFANFDVEGEPTTDAEPITDTTPRTIEVEDADEALAAEHGVVTLNGYGSRTDKANAMKVGGVAGLYEGDTMVIAGESRCRIDGEALQQGKPITFAEGGVAKLAQLGGGVFDYEVLKVPTYTLQRTPDGFAPEPTGRYALAPSTDPQDLWNCDVSEDYEVIQPSDSFAPLDSLQLPIERVGTWKGGRIAFAQTAPMEFDLDNGHSYQGRTMISNALDGSGSWRFISNAVNTECWNFYLANMRKDGLRIKHITGANTKLKQLDALAQSQGKEAFFALQEQLNQWLKLRMSDDDVALLLAKVFKPSQVDEETGARAWSSTQLGQVSRFLDLYESGTLDGVQVAGGAAPGTLYGFAQAATAYETHIMAAREGRDTDPLAQWEYLNAGAGYRRTRRWDNVASEFASNYEQQHQQHVHVTVVS